MAKQIDFMTVFPSFLPTLIGFSGGLTFASPNGYGLKSNELDYLGIESAQAVLQGSCFLTASFLKVHP
jgi:hypothetical protein